MYLFQVMLSRYVTPQVLTAAEERFVKDACYRVLGDIRRILADETLSDETCFRRIEAIVCALEDVGISCGGRHDFG